ncbi:MAG: triose-phosphate isomerase [Acidobacteriota bacterium]|nr:triose-phosphate isomerase [Acidobacteriota bacterium]
MSRRTPLVAANWKMHKVRQEAKAYCSDLRQRLAGVTGVEVVLFPGPTLLTTVAEGLAGSTIAWGGQDLHPEPQGAHTGDVSAAQLTDVGCSWVLCGHSERRQDHGETSELVGAKAAAARRGGLKPMVCIGETEGEREDGRTFEVLERQLAAALDAEPNPGALAYEPVWAIGTGKTATPELAQEVHEFLRQRLGKLRDPSFAEALRILYGGSVKPGNAGSLIVQEDIDGFLVGGAGLDPEPFSGIINSSCA